jgi:Zn-dependent peptidase ImmA (M78 family)
MLIRQTLTHVTSNREEAAKALGISRRALQYKLKEYGLIESQAHEPTGSTEKHDHEMRERVEVKAHFAESKDTLSPTSKVDPPDTSRDRG